VLDVVASEYRPSWFMGLSLRFFSCCTLIPCAPNSCYK
jgi:hypothetical protein